MKILKTVLSFAIILTMLFSFNGCLKYSSNILEVNNSVTSTTQPTVETTAPIVETTAPIVETTTLFVPETTTLAPIVENTTVAPVTEITTAAPVVESTTAAPIVETTTQPVVDPSSWTTSEILSALSTAINKTKAYTGNVTVAHKESFEGEILDCTGGSMVKSIANNVITSVAKPVDETLSFSNSTAVNSEGETVQILLPIDAPFTLSLSGVASANATKSGDSTVITITLVEENCGVYDGPVHNAAAIGYLTLSELDLSIITLTGGGVKYLGSSIKATINADGYVTSCEYKVPLYIEGTGEAMGISGFVSLEGVQTEIWTINW